MVKKVSHEEVLALLDQGAPLLEVLPRQEYEHYRIRGARSLPLKELNPESAGRYQPAEAVIVYCSDNL